MSIYEFDDYRRFLRSEFAKLPKKGRGQARKLADALKVHPVVVSQVLGGTRDLSHEQALETALYLGLDERATEYFSLLVLRARAGTKKLEQHLTKKLEAMRTEASFLMKRVVQKHRKLNEEDMGKFYSDWYYSGIRLLTSVPGFGDVDAIARHYRLSRARVGEIVAYLEEKGLCVRDAKGRLSMGTTSTFITGESPFANGHHRNWRAKAMEAQIHQRKEDLFYTSPCSLSAADKEKFREELKKLIASFSQRVQDSPAELVACLNIDWFEI